MMYWAIGVDDALASLGWQAPLVHLGKVYILVHQGKEDLLASLG
jgi:hypothetical protein